MRRVFGIFLIWPLLCLGQQGEYVDTIRGKVTIKYNNPLRMKVSLLAGGAFEITGLDGGVFLPSAFADFHIRPVKWVSLHAAYTEQFQLGWQNQKVKNSNNLEFGGRILFIHKYLDKFKTYTAGTDAWLYDFNIPVKVLWSMGVSGSYRKGTGVFNSGVDPNTAIRFQNLETQQIKFLEQIAVPYSFSEWSAGFVLNTSSAMKVKAHLPFGQTRSRRMKTFTEFRVEAVFGMNCKVDQMVSVKPSDDAIQNDNYTVIVNQVSKTGLKLQGIFRRKWIGFKFEAGIRPGINYRFSGSAENGPLNRAYLLLGMGIGWM